MIPAGRVVPPLSDPKLPCMFPFSVIMRLLRNFLPVSAGNNYPRQAGGYMHVSFTSQFTMQGTDIDQLLDDFNAIFRPHFEGIKGFDQFFKLGAALFGGIESHRIAARSWRRRCLAAMRW